MIATFKMLLAALGNAYTWIIFIYVILSWIPMKSGILRDIDNVLGKICDPYLNLFRKLVPPIGGIVDITPIIALVVLQLAIRVILTIL